MQNKNTFVIGIVFFVLVLALSTLVSSLGITPARTAIDFSPNLEKKVGFSIVNSEKANSNFAVYARGELNQSIYLTESTFAMTSSDSSHEMQYTIKLPSELSPGIHTAEIVVLQLPGTAGTSEAFVGAAVGVVTQLQVYVPYPGKYAEADMSIVNAEKGADATFVIPVTNLGKLDLVDIKANIDIYNKLNEKVGTFNTDSISLLSGKKGTIVSKWKADVPVGTYRAVATVIYDTQTITLEKQFNVGSSDLDLQQIEVRDFSLGEIAKFEMLIENKWTEPVVGAYTQTQVFNEEGEVMADFKSPTKDIPALTKVVLDSYWDTKGVHVGTYETTINLRYGEKSTQKDLKLDVQEDKINVIGLGYVISESKSGKGGSSSLVTILIIVIVVLVLINILWFLTIRKKLAGVGAPRERTQKESKTGAIHIKT